MKTLAELIAAREEKLNDMTSILDTADNDEKSELTED